ncbi:MAG: tRNA (adenosine(37)-N6)-dimethylallyltransferase MiaA [Planctomycetota bacterium]|jgi:tRNA dimethylallyltransferase
MIQRVLVGATASGKKSVAAALHERHGVRLLSMDSIKVYRGMDIGTDKPDAALRRQAPFELLDLVGHDQPFSAGDWVRAAQAVLAAGSEPALFAGGTPFYLRLLLHGLCPAPPSDPTLRRELDELWERKGEAAVRDALAAGDPELAARLLPGDRKRLLRGLEVLRATGRPLSVWQSEHTRPVVEGRILVAALRRPPAVQHERAGRRVERMLERGLVEEVEALQARAPFAREPARAIGYAEVLAMLGGRLEPAALPERMRIRTRQLLRKQRQHLNALPDIEWVDVDADESDASVATRVARVLEL